MQQSNFIFGILVVAYIVFITVKGELGTYLGLLKGAGTPAPTNQSTSGASSGAGIFSSLSGGSNPFGNLFNKLAGGSSNAGGNIAGGSNAATSNNPFQNQNTFNSGESLDSLFGGDF